MLNSDKYSSRSSKIESCQLILTGLSLLQHFQETFVLQSNPINTNTEGAIKSVQINRVSLQALQGPLAAGREYNRKESLQLYLWNFNSASNSLVAPHRTEQSDFHQTAPSRNKRKYKQSLKNTWKHAPRVMMSLLMSSPPISISHRLFRCRYSNSKDVVASSPFFSHSAARAPQRACSQAITGYTY